MADDKKSGGKPAAKPELKAETKPATEVKSVDDKAPAEAVKADAPAIDPLPANAEPWPDATPQPMRPVEAPLARERAETVAMPIEVAVGKPPEVPAVVPNAPVALGSVEDPTFMPGPREIPGGNPEDPAAPPGRVPPGDSRSLRRVNEFALIYRMQTCVISRFGVIGTRGQWRVVDYPTSSSASNAYARETSRFVSEGFSDYRD
jgi:hypothetical protein